MTPEHRKTAPCFAPTGPGWYELRDGSRAWIVGRAPEGIKAHYPWVGHREDGVPHGCTAEGRAASASGGDIIGPWRELRQVTMYRWLGMNAQGDAVTLATFNEEPKPKQHGLLALKLVSTETVTEGEFPCPPND